MGVWLNFITCKFPLSSLCVTWMRLVDVFWGWFCSCRWPPPSPYVYTTRTTQEGARTRYFLNDRDLKGKMKSNIESNEESFQPDLISNTNLFVCFCNLSNTLSTHVWVRPTEQFRLIGYGHVYSYSYFAYISNILLPSFS